MLLLEFGKLSAVIYSLTVFRWTVFRTEICWLIGEVFSFEENVDEVHSFLTPQFD